MKKSKLQRALQLVVQKWYIFPITAGAKVPPLVKWSKVSSNDPKQIKQWWKKWPDANIGINCEMSGLAVIDLDLKPTKNGIKSFDLLEKANKVLPDTRIAQTPSGGLHMFTIGKMPSSIDKLGSGIDVRSIGGYVVAPGSEVLKASPNKKGPGEYEWYNKKKLCKLPKWLSDLGVSLANIKKENIDKAVIELDQEHNIKWAKKFLAEDAKPAIEGDHGDFTTFKTISVLRERGISEQMAEELVLEYYNERCEPPWHIEDMQKKVVNAYSYSSLDAPGAQTAEADFDDTYVDGESADGVKDCAIPKEEPQQNLPSVFKEWVWIYPLKCFVRKSDYLTIDAKAFDSNFNYVVEGASISTHIFNSRKLMPKYEGLCFEPASDEVVKQKFNMWKPSEVIRKAGDVSWFTDHVRFLVEDREKEFNLIMSYLAWCVQKPKEKMGFALLIQGGQGIGKSWLGDLMEVIIGPHNTTAPSNEELHSRFNPWAKHAQLCVIHELMASGRLDLANKLKPLITDKEIRIEEKKINIYGISNKMNLLIFTNWPDAIPLESDDRRYLIVLSNAKAKDAAYYNDLFKKLKFAGQVLDYLMKYDISQFIGRGKAPVTDDKQVMKELGYDDLDQHFLHLYRGKLYPFHSDLVAMEDLIDTIPGHIMRTQKRIHYRITMFFTRIVAAKKLGQHRVTGTGHKKVLWSVRSHGIYKEMEAKIRYQYYMKRINEQAPQ